jgi:hypothetical protein
VSAFDRINDSRPMRGMIDECIGLLATSEHSCPKTDKSHLI